MLAVFLLSIASVSASEIEDTLASEDTNTTELSVNNDIIEDTLQTSKENDELSLNSNDETLSVKKDAEILGENPGTFSGLATEIGSGGNIELQHDYYTYDTGYTIYIKVANSVIDGKGAVIDMAGSNTQVFSVSVSGVTFKNLTIKNVNCDQQGGAIAFGQSGTLLDCNFINITSTLSGGAVKIQTGTVSNCNFINNTGAKGGAIYFNSAGTVSNCNFTNNMATKSSSGSDGGAIYFYNTGAVLNCNFINNTASQHAGAILFERGPCTVSNSNFTNNKAGYDSGAVYFKGECTGASAVSNCSFTNNSASRDGGAVYFDIVSTVSNCSFTSNSASGNGGAVYFYRKSSTAFNSTFVKNSATRNGGAIFSYQSSSVADACIFKENKGDNYRVTIYPPTLNVENFTTLYGSGEKVTFDLKTRGGIPITDGNISISVYFKDGDWVGNYSCLSGEDWIPDLPVGSYYAIYNTEYGNFKPVNRSITITLPDVKYSINVTSITTPDKTVNITAKSDIPKNILWDGKLLFILPDNTEINATYGSNGTWWALHTFDDYGDYPVNATYVGLDNVTVKNGTVSIRKIPTEISVLNDTLVLKVPDVVATGASLIPPDAGNLTYTVSNSSVVKVENGKIIAVGQGSAVVTVSFAGNDKYVGAENKTISVTVKLGDASVSVNNDTLDLRVKDTFDLKATTDPEGLNVSYSSTNESVVTVDSEGKVTAVGVGNATIVVTVGDNKAYAVNSTNVKVNVKIPTEISIADSTVDLKANEEIATGASLTPADAGNVTYTSTNSSVAVVKDGKIIAIGAGTANIIVSFAGNGEYAAAENKTIGVTVSLNDASVSVNNATLDLIIDETFTIVPTTNPEGLNVTFTPDNSGVVSVDENGVVTALKEGEATVKVSVGGDRVYALNTTDVTVTVKKIPTEIIANATLNMYVGDVAEGVATLKPYTGDNLTYASNPNIVKVEDGKLVAVANGTANVIVTYEGNDKYESANSKIIEVTVKLKDASVSVNDADLDLVVKDTFKLVATTVPEGLNVSYASTNESVVTVDSNGTVTAVGTGKATIVVSVGDDKVYAVNSTNVTVTVKLATSITAADVSTTYKVNKDLVITLKDANGKAIANVKVTVDLKGAKTYTTDKNGQVKVSTKGLAPKTYPAKVTFNGNDDYAKSTKNVKVTVKKATPKLTAKKKTFKKSTKTKKYTIVLKDNTGKAIKKAKVTLKVKGKTYKATTNSKGKATFKIKKLKKKGTFKAKITYKGNKYYKKVSKKATIKVISTWKTISKGSKAKSTVKEIQQALKDNGYYLSYKGHYLKVDGKFESCTQRSVKEFQKDKGLKVTGKVDEKTAKKLGIL